MKMNRYHVMANLEMKRMRGGLSTKYVSCENVQRGKQHNLQPVTYLKIYVLNFFPALGIKDGL